MNKYDLISKIEKIAPLENQEKWDCSGWIVETSKKEIHKVMLALTPTDDVIEQARDKNCDMIISHHPLFCIPCDYKDVDIYASHTPLDKAKGGTTDTLIQTLGFNDYIIENDFVRVLNFNTTVEDFYKKLQNISNNIRIVNNKNKKNISKIAFCAGSGAEFINLTDADCFVTGDLKYHTAVESDKILFDIGHFESEILVLKSIKKILGIEVEFAYEKSPFI